MACLCNSASHLAKLMTTSSVRGYWRDCSHDQCCWQIGDMTLTGAGRSSNNRARGPTFRRSAIEKSRFAFSPYLYRARNLVERFFNKLKQCRRVAIRYDKLAADYLAFVKLAAIRIWLRVYESTPVVPKRR